MDKFANALADAANRSNDNNDKILHLLEKIENHLYRLDKGQDEIIEYVKEYIRGYFPGAYENAVQNLMYNE